VTVIEALLLGQVQLTDIPGGRLDSQLLLGFVLGKNREWLMAHGEEEVTHDQQIQFEALLAKRASHIPVVHLTNNREFYGLDFYIDADVLTPRVETEQMVDWAIKYAPKDSTLIDIGTGSGAIAIAIAKHRPDLEIWATEVTDEAMTVARKNAKKHKVDLKFIKANLFGGIDEKFATVVTNLPYLKEDADLMIEVQKEPGVALFGGPDGLDIYRRFLKQLPIHLEAGGYLFTECDPWQQDQLIIEARAARLKPIEQGYFIMGFQGEK
jgi:release factor glutamine methyltransferase